jgi:hypothetical protein
MWEFKKNINISENIFILQGKNKLIQLDIKINKIYFYPNTLFNSNILKKYSEIIFV